MAAMNGIRSRRPCCIRRLYNSIGMRTAAIEIPAYETAIPPHMGGIPHAAVSQTRGKPRKTYSAAPPDCGRRSIGEVRGVG